MPIYEYKCQDCGTKFEKLVRKTSEDAGVECPSCGQKAQRGTECSAQARRMVPALPGCEPAVCASGLPIPASGGDPASFAGDGRRSDPGWRRSVARFYPANSSGIPQLSAGGRGRARPQELSFELI